MICKCKLPIIRGYEPDLYCLQCGLKLKNKTMNEKKIKDVIKLKAGFRYLNQSGFFERSIVGWALQKSNDGLWSTGTGTLKFSETTIRENPELFEDVYEEPERKKICVEIEYDELNLSSRNIKVTEIKPLSKEDAGWFYKKGVNSLGAFEYYWAEFQAKKEAENGK